MYFALEKKTITKRRDVYFIIVSECSVYELSGEISEVEIVGVKIKGLKSPHFGLYSLFYRIQIQ